MDQVTEIVLAPSAYQVFISHRGADVKKTLASLIYHRLTNCGLAVFLDKDEIQAGDTISDAISSAIHSSSVHIVIFSEGFAESSWCLDELYWILRSHHKRNTKIIPVFFDVEPAEVCHIKIERYAKAFENHTLKGRVTKNSIGNWKAALKEAAKISGPVFKTNESDYGEFLEKIAKIVLKGVFELEPFEVAEYPVGLDQAAEDFQNEIQKQSHLNTSMIVGITGMPGVGKSTLVRHLYHLKRPDFSRSCFLCDVRKRDLPSLQEKFLRDLVGHYKSYSISQGKSNLRKCLRNLPRIFVVLDDVDHMDQINHLIDTKNVASGSLILITSRDKDLLRRSSANTIIYDVKLLHINHARELFCRHAFPECKPCQGFEDLVEQFLKNCGGLPLSLKVLGGLFVGQSDKDKNYWKRLLEKLSTRLLDDIIKPLEVSYKALDPVEKQVFLDIGCFLVGEEKELALRVLEGLYENSNIGDYLESLRQRCLLDFHYDVSDKEIQRRKSTTEGPELDNKFYGSYKITMHDQLRELARHFAREEFRVFSTPNPLRLSCSNDILEMLRWQGGSHLRIRGIRSSGDEHGKFPNDIRLEALHIIVIEDSKDLSTVFGSCDISGELVWLRLRNVGPFHLPRSISLRGLKVLEIEGGGDSIQELFNNFDPDLPAQLNEFNVIGDHWTMCRNFFWQKLPSIFRYSGWQGTGVKSLTKLVLQNLPFQGALPIDFSQLQNLRHLDLSGCRDLTRLPNTFSQLLQLQYLSLQGCFSLSIPLSILGEISTLECVDFNGCAKLVALPLGIPYQRHLRYMNLLSTGLLQLPDNLELLGKLEQLAIGSHRIKELPLSLANLKGLTELILFGCDGLQRILPKGIAAPNIKFLVINDCQKVDNFFFHQESVDSEDIDLKVGMSLLRDFTLKYTSISEICIPDGVLPRIESIDLSRNSRLMKVNALPSGLVRLDLSHCTGLKTLPTSNLVNLKHLIVSNCWELDTLDVGGLISLQEIEAEECWRLKRIGGSECGRLNCLNISTDTRLIWNDICNFLTSSSHEKFSTARFSALADPKSMFTKEEMRCILGKFNLKMVDMVSASTTRSEFGLKLEKFHSHSGMLMCIITKPAHNIAFDVEFRTSNSSYGGPDDHHITFRLIDGPERRLHIFLWTEESDLFRDYKEYRDIDVYCTNFRAEMAWIVMVDEWKEVLEVCKEMITAFA